MTQVPLIRPTSSADRERLLSYALRSRKESGTAEFKYDHPGQKEPRAPGEIHHENRIVDLNTASEEELADLPMVDRSAPES